MLKILVACIILLIAAFVVAFFSLNFLVKKTVNTVGQQITKVDVKLSVADLSPLSGSGSLLHLQIGNPEGYSSPFSLLLGGVQITTHRTSLFSDPIIIKEITIRDPEINIEGTPLGNNLTKLLSNLKSSSNNSSGEETATDSKKSKKLIVREIIITGAKLHVHFTAANQSLDQTLVLPDIALHNIGSDGSGVSTSELSRQILTPLLNSAIREGGIALAKQGIKQLENQGAGQLNKVLGNFLK
jgi:uncharacterized protein involved in outer membrane biogenesis